MHIVLLLINCHPYSYLLSPKLKYIADSYDIIIIVKKSTLKHNVIEQTCNRGKILNQYKNSMEYILVRTVVHYCWVYSVRDCSMSVFFCVWEIDRSDLACTVD